MATRPAKSKPGTGSKRPAAKQKPVPRPRRARAPKPRPLRSRPESLRLRSVSPSLTVDDLERSIDFYTRALGFVIQEEWIDKGERVGVMLRAGRIELGLGRDDWAKGRDRKKGQGLRLYLETVQDVDGLAKRVRAAGGRITDGPKLHSWGAYALAVDDPDGFHLTVYRQDSPRKP